MHNRNFAEADGRLASETWFSIATLLHRWRVGKAWSPLSLPSETAWYTLALSDRFSQHGSDTPQHKAASDFNGTEQEMDSNEWLSLFVV